MTMHSAIRILQKRVLSSRYCRKLLSTAVYSEDKAESNESALAFTERPIEIKPGKSPNYVLDLLREVTKNGSERNAEVIIKEILSNITTNQLFVTKEYAAEILQHKDCRYAFNVINDNVRALSTKEVIDTLLLLKKFRVPQKSRIVQNTLAVLRKSINDLTITQIVSIAKLLHNYNDTPLAKALLSGLEVIFELKIRTEMDKTDLNETAYVFQHLGLLGWTDSMKPITLFLYKHIEDQNVTCPSAVRIYCGLCRMKDYSYDEVKLLRRTKDAIMREKDLLRIENIFDLLTSIKYIHELGIENKVGSGGFIEMLCRQMISLEPGKTDLVRFMNLLSDLDHVSDSLLEDLDMHYKMPKLGLLNLKFRTEFTLHCVEYFSMTNYKPKYWKNIKESITSDLLQECTNKERLFLTLNLLALDCFIPELVEKVLNMDVDSSYDELLILNIYRIVKVLHPKSSLQATPLITKKIRDLCDYKPFIEESKLKRCLGSAAYMKSGLKTELGHIIDHTLLLNDYGNFVPFDSTSGIESAKFVNDLKLPSNRHIVLLQTLPCHAHHANGYTLKGVHHIAIKCLQTLTHCSVMTVNRKYIETLSRDKLESNISRAIEENGNYQFVTNYQDDEVIKVEE